MSELLIELLTEDIPARMQLRGGKDFKSLIEEALKKAGLSYDSAKAETTPRRIVLSVKNLTAYTEASTEEKRGPRVGLPEQALKGFMRANGLESMDECEIRETKKGEFYFLTTHKKGQATADILPKIITDAISAMTWQKSMSWGSSDFTWVRPLLSILAVFDGAKLEGSFDLGGDMPPLFFTDKTVGHRFMGADEFTVDNMADYEEKLREHKVILSRDERRQIIMQQGWKLAEAEGLTVKEDVELLDEVIGLVEYPVPLIGKIDDDFMDVPEEVLITSMKSHQRYFSCLDSSGRLANRFIVVANVETTDMGETIVKGNEKVLRARLQDAKFFWETDKQKPLEDYVPKLHSLIFHKDLGSVADRTERLQSLAVDIARITPADIDKCRSAAMLSKADLVTGMVVEFTSLQGVMGGYYAVVSGEDVDVGKAIAEHYSPQGPHDDCPTAPVSVAVALADKIDALVGFFAIGQTPTGSKDPYALRRSALGTIRLILENNLRLSLSDLFAASYIAYDEQGVKNLRPLEEVTTDLIRFFGDRLTVLFRDKGYRHDMISAVTALGLEDDLLRLRQRVEALRDFLKSDDGNDLLAAYRRASNILKKEEKKDAKTYDGTSDIKIATEDEEKTLITTLEKLEIRTTRLVEDETYEEAMEELSKLRQPLDNFFEKVTVNASDETSRSNRLALLSQIRRTMNMVADFSKLEG